MINIFKSDYQKFEDVKPLNIFVFRVFFALLCFMMCLTAWSNIFTHQRDCLPMDGEIWCLWAAYVTISVFGLYKTLKMLPILLFIIFHKTLWLIVVAYPLLKTDKLICLPSEELVTIFIWPIVPSMFFPWKYL